MIYFTADLHLNHKNIIKYCNRPFETIKYMDIALLNNWNNVVKPTDDIYVLGDFCLGNDLKLAQEYFDSLNGKKYLIRGNHDKLTMKIQGWNWIKDLYEVNYMNISITLCHYAMRVWNKSHYGSWHLFGHSHGTLERIKNSCDIGVDSWGFKPVSFLQLNELFIK